MGFRRKKVTVIEYIQLLIAKGVLIHPTLLNQYFDELTKLKNNNKICLTPTTLLNNYHHSLLQKIKKSA